MAPEILRNEPSNEKFVSAKPELQVFYFRIISKWFNWIIMALSSCDCEQVWCVQLWCHPMGVNDRVHSMEQLKRLTGLIFSQLNSSTFYFTFETSNFVVHTSKNFHLKRLSESWDSWIKDWSCQMGSIRK